MSLCITKTSATWNGSPVCELFHEKDWLRLILAMPWVPAHTVPGVVVAGESIYVKSVLSRMGSYFQEDSRIPVNDELHDPAEVEWSWAVSLMKALGDADFRLCRDEAREAHMGNHEHNCPYRCFWILQGGPKKVCALAVKIKSMTCVEVTLWPHDAKAVVVCTGRSELVLELLAALVRPSLHVLGKRLLFE